MGDQVDFIVTQKKKHAPIPILSSPLLINNDRFLRAAGKKAYWFECRVRYIRREFCVSVPSSIFFLNKYDNRERLWQSLMSLVCQIFIYFYFFSAGSLISLSTGVGFDNGTPLRMFRWSSYLWRWPSWTGNSCCSMGSKICTDLYWS